MDHRRQEGRRGRSAITRNGVVAIDPYSTRSDVAGDHSLTGTNVDMSRLHSGKGPCCDGGDAKRVDDVDWEARTVAIACALMASWLTFRTKL
jgi:hypothetical protein